MSDEKQVERFNIATKDKTPLDIWLALKAFFAKVAEANGDKLDESWDQQDEKFSDSQPHDDQGNK